jgi:hypothetical protein
MTAIIGLGLVVMGIAALWSIRANSGKKSGPFTRKSGL